MEAALIAHHFRCWNTGNDAGAWNARGRLTAGPPTRWSASGARGWPGHLFRIWDATPRGAKSSVIMEPCGARRGPRSRFRDHEEPGAAQRAARATAAAGLVARAEWPDGPGVARQGVPGDGRQPRS